MQMGEYAIQRVHVPAKAAESPTFNTIEKPKLISKIVERLNFFYQALFNDEVAGATEAKARQSCL